MWETFEKEEEFREHIREEHPVDCEHFDLCDTDQTRKSVDLTDNQPPAMNQEGER